MKRWQTKPQHYGILAVFSFIVAAIVFSGLVLRNDIPGRLLIGVAWSAVGVGWLFRYYDRRLKAREGEIRDLRKSLSDRVRDTTAQQERIRLARELHDTIKQQIFGISMGAAAAKARWSTDPQGAKEALDDVQRGAQEAMAEMNALLQQLSPAPLEKVGLTQALRDQCEALGYRTDAEVTVQFGDLAPDDQWPVGAQESLFRIAQEAFSNVARHARARHVHLYLGQTETGGAVKLEIQDDGQGFEVGQVEGGMGLENIHQRALALSGTLALESTPGRGTTLSVHIPLNPPTASARQPKYHPLDKGLLVGLATGLVVSALLFYPLYVLVPGRYAAGWPPGSDAIGLLLCLAALLSAGGGGYLAARWIGATARWHGTLCGALAGSVAGALTFFCFGAPASAVAGGTALLARGQAAALGRAGAIDLLAASVSGIVHCIHAGFWVALLSGAALGGIGGLTAPPKKQHPDHRPNQRLTAQIVLTALTLVSALSLGVATARFAQLEPAIREGLAVNGLLQQAPPLLEHISDWLVGTPLVLYLASSIAAWFTLWIGIKKTEDPAKLGAAQVTAALLALVSLGLPLSLAIVGIPVLPRGVAALPRGWMDLTGLPHASPASLGDAVGAHLWIPGLVGSLAMGGLHLVALSAAHRRQRAMGARDSVRAGLQLMVSRSGGVGLGSVIATAVPPMALISTVNGMGLVSKLPLELLIGSELEYGVTPAKLIRSLYLNQASALLTTFVAAIAIVGLVSLLVDGIRAVLARLAV